MPREIDERKKRKALRKLRKIAERAEAGLGPPLSDWEREFLQEMEARIETFGSAFADPDKGHPGEPLSALQAAKLKQIDRQARGKPPSGFGRPNPAAEEADTSAQRGGDADGSVPDPAAQTAPKAGRPVLRVITGGKSD